MWILNTLLFTYQRNATLARWAKEKREKHVSYMDKTLLYHIYKYDICIYIYIVVISLLIIDNQPIN